MQYSLASQPESKIVLHLEERFGAIDYHTHTCVHAIRFPRLIPACNRYYKQTHIVYWHINIAVTRFPTIQQLTISKQTKSVKKSIGRYFIMNVSASYYTSSLKYQYRLILPVWSIEIGRYNMNVRYRFIIVLYLIYIPTSL